MNLRCGWWHICYRLYPTGTILSDRSKEYIVIPNRWYACAMDSIVFEHQGETYIFAEIYSVFRQRGVIGYVKWDEKRHRFSKWKTVLIEPFHLSYPFVFHRGNEVYMIPESYQSGKVILYKAISFPDKWERVDVLIDNVKFVDTTLFEDKGEYFAFTYDISNQQDKHLLLYRLDDRLHFHPNPVLVSSNDAVARPGGYIFNYNGTLVRVSQDCDGAYGKATVFSEISSNFRMLYEERILLHLGIHDVRLNRRISSLGIHTYTSTHKFEVIDVKGRKFHPIDVLVRMWKKAGKLFSIMKGK